MKQINSALSNLLSTLLLIIALLSINAKAHQVNFVNGCDETVLVGILAGEPGMELPEEGGFILRSGAMYSVAFPNNWSGRFWGRTGCDSDGQNCETGRCGGDGGLNCQGNGGEPPATLAEISFDTAVDGVDFYDISLVDGFNLPMTMAPIPGTYTLRVGDNFDCGEAGCVGDLNSSCPPELRVIGRSGDVVACMSACEAFDTDEYCCRNAYGLPTACPPFIYSQIIAEACPRAYSYAYDDARGTFTCSGNGPGVSGYEVNFCPVSGSQGIRINMEVDGATTDDSSPDTVTDCGCPGRCTSDVLDQDANAFRTFTCRERINYMMSASQYTELQACADAASLFPDTCGKGCSPCFGQGYTSEGSPSPPTPSPSYPPASALVYPVPAPSLSPTPCGCASCTSEVLDRMADTFSCRDRIHWVKGGDHTEIEACAVVSSEFPDICGQGCNPNSCNAPPISCGCSSSRTSSVLDRMAGGYSCRARIQWVMDNTGAKELNACRLVKDEFPDICNPDIC